MTAEEIFQSIYNWNKDRDLLKEFNHHLQTMLLAEELFEFCGYERNEAKALSREFASKHSNISSYVKNGKVVIATNPERQMTASDMVDALGDIIYIAIGAIYIAGYDPKKVLSTICQHNDAKGNKKDKFGKIIKDETFIEPQHN